MTPFSHGLTVRDFPTVGQSVEVVAFYDPRDWEMIGIEAIDRDPTAFDILPEELQERLSIYAEEDWDSARDEYEFEVKNTDFVDL